MKRKAAWWITATKGVIIAFVSFILYNVFLYFYPLKKEIIYDNKERAEEFVYSKQRYSVIFVGSGLIGDFSPASVRRSNYFNLFFPYSGSCTGVKVIALSNKIPDTLFVETNYLYKGFDQQLLEDVFRPGLYQARFALPALQEKHQVFSFLKEQIKPSKIRQLKLARYPEPQYSQELTHFKEEYQVLPDSLRLRQDLDSLQYYLNYLSSKNCKIFFFEMPVDRQLSNYPKMKSEKYALQQVFDKKIKWVAPDTLGRYATIDGVHLLEKSVYQYLAYFNQNIHRLASNSK
ncbi:hypothetical protein [Hymenobacter crusticola]|uniref:SGNH/GDSL hydrolase family protein n=1 Tax=Hymenobacter crusticola TaxID=1770526 RepID=A0A243W7Z0_9BACT|nr:hypothetical protein [Hymenobacter crusticola]OUJ71201.1 hypothetical protein BXP70_22225 [Hymenobacter crusticola]